MEGENLYNELQSQGIFSETKIYQLLENILPVLQFIHDRQVIHRDIKPDNI
ncbi:MAG: protein kinase domain-containing protein, partial [Pseudanabaena sp.]